MDHKNSNVLVLNSVPYEFQHVIVKEKRMLKLMQIVVEVP